MIFEDNKEMPISKLISYVYEESGIVVHFVGGNRNIKAEVEKNYDKDDAYIIFLDLVPDNHSAINEYRKLQLFIDESMYDNVTVIPIPCIEYYVLKLIEMPDVKEIEVALEFGKYKNTDLCVKLLRGKCKNFEKYCKKVLEHKTAICYRNEQGERYGAWYHGDCLCGNSKSGCIEENRRSKGNRLVSALPVSYRKWDMLQTADSVNVDEKHIQKKCMEKYKEVESLFREYGYIN